MNSSNPISSAAKRSRLAAKALATALLLATSAAAQAVPSFARQTGLECTSCHLSWPELTPTGRQFKLNGYTTGDRQRFPVAAMIQASRTASASVDPSAPDQFPKDRDVVLQQASLFAAGKINDHVGVFSQWSYDGVAHHSSIDNVDLRYANRWGDKSNELVYGFTLHNNPTVQDIYNTGPAWGFPFASSSVAVPSNASTLVDGGLAQQVAGIGAYLRWKKMLYAELSAYRTADKAFSVLRAGTDRAADAALKGYNPYWRVALEREWDDGKHSAMIGAYGLTVNRYPDATDPTGPTDHFADTGVDAQYQYITDKHRFSAQTNWIHEKQDWNASFAAGGTENPSNHLNTNRSKLTYYYDTKYGATLGYVATSGSTDNVLYNTGSAITGSANASPNMSAYVVELNYLPKRDIRLALQYTSYRKFNGASDNYDGLGRNARDNNTTYLLAWFMF